MIACRFATSVANTKKAGRQARQAGKAGKTRHEAGKAEVGPGCGDEQDSEKDAMRRVSTVNSCCIPAASEEEEREWHECSLALLLHPTASNKGKVAGVQARQRTGQTRVNKG